MSEVQAVIDRLIDAVDRDLPFVAHAEAIVDADRAIRRLQGLLHAHLEIADRSGIPASEAGSTAAWLRGQTAMSPAQASGAVHLARDLADVLPTVREALCDGEISVDHARIAAGLRKDLRDDALVRDVDKNLADAAKELPISAFRDWMTDVRHSLKPEAVVDDERTAFDNREFSAHATLYGTGVGHFTLDPVSFETVMTAIHLAAPPVAGDGRTNPQRLADGVITVSQFFLDHHGAETIQKKALPHISVIATLPTAIGQAESRAGQTGLGQRISGEAIRRLSCDATVARIVFGPRSELIDAGRDTRIIPAAIRRAVTARDLHCIWPDCTAPPAWCDAHHCIHWSKGGPTNVDNLALLCGRHHDRVHHHQHTIVIRADGSRSVDPAPNTVGIFGPVLDQRTHSFDRSGDGQRAGP